MKLARAELSVALVVCAVAAAAVAISLDYALLKSLTNGADEAFRTRHDVLIWLSLGLLAAAALGAMFVILPLLRHHDREQGKLQSLAGLLKERSKKLETAALTDALTGMHNRRFFDVALTQYVAEFARIQRPIGLVLIDLDHFKQINDTHGHDVGDAVLRAVALCLFEFTRYHDVVARIGGEEFAIIAPNLDETELHRFAEKLRHQLSRLTIDVEGATIAITASMGIASARPGDGAAAIMKRADVNLYHAKQSGRNRVAA
ncbi:MAG: GGDEF domain-containing protein [Fulvimarina sp.]|nr:GGDEF domain-containing protein [Fulvimarina sp.]